MRELEFRTTPDAYPCQQEALESRATSGNFHALSSFIDSHREESKLHFLWASAPCWLRVGARGYGGAESQFALLPTPFHFSLPGLQISLNIKSE